MWDIWLPLVLFFLSAKLVQLITVITQTTLRLLLLHLFQYLLYCLMKQHTLLTNLPNLPIPINYTFLLLTFPPSTIYWLNSSSRAGLLFICGLLLTLEICRFFGKINQFVIECIETLLTSLCFFDFSQMFGDCISFVFIIWKKDW